MGNIEKRILQNQEKLFPLFLLCLRAKKRRKGSVRETGVSEVKAAEEEEKKWKRGEEERIKTFSPPFSPSPPQSLLLVQTPKRTENHQANQYIFTLLKSSIYFAERWRKKYTFAFNEKGSSATNVNLRRGK